jgi:hypothetical protein
MQDRFKILSRFSGVTIDGVWIGEWIYLTTYTHDSELKALTTLPPDHTLKSPV